MKKVLILSLATLTLAACADKKEKEAEVAENKAENQSEELLLTEVEEIGLPLQEVESDDVELVEDAEDTEENPTMEENPVVDSEELNEPPTNKEPVAQSPEEPQDSTEDKYTADTTKTKEEAIAAVRARVGVDSATTTVVNFDHMDGEEYIIHVYDVIDMGNGQSHASTLGWYRYDPKIKKVDNAY